jgi:outer membrane protein OmpA-like peptidoglycan-associated protein
MLSTPLRANIVGTGPQNFNPTPDGLDFITVQSSETLAPGLINFGVFLNYAVNSLPYYESTPQTRTTFNDTLTSSDINAAIGLKENWEAGISFPAVLTESVGSNGPAHSEFSKSGFNEVRLNSKYRLQGDESGGVAVIGTVNFNTVKNNPFTGVDPGPTYNLELAYDHWIHEVNLAANVGYRWANPGPPVPDVPIAPTGDQVLVSVAGSRLLHGADLKLILEVFGAFPVQRKNTNWDRSSTFFEALGGVKYDWSQALAFHAGAGTEMIQGASSPDWRVYCGFNYVFDTKSDEVVPTMGQLIPSTPSSPTAEEKFVVSNVNFEFDSDRMSSESEKVLETVARALREGGAFKTVTITGHTDSIGKDEYNKALSLKRAEAIRQHLVEKYNFTPEEIEAAGKGEEEPIADNGNFQGRKLNRRVEFKITR